MCHPLISIPVFAGRRFDVVLHDPTHPVRLLALHFRASEDVVTVLGIGSLLSPSQQFFEEHIIQGNGVFRTSVLTLPMCCFTIERLGVSSFRRSRYLPI